MKKFSKAQLRNFKEKFFKNIGKIKQPLFYRLLFAILINSPALMFHLAASWIKMRRWRKIGTCLKFIKRNNLAFENIDVTTLSVESVSGGVSNANQIWKFRNRFGGETAYFVKVFTPIGSFWAKHLPLVTPFPFIYGRHTHQRFTVDMLSRVQLADQGVPVPRLIAYDTVQGIMVAEYLKGETVDEILTRIADLGRIDENEREVIRRCGFGLGKVHRAGFSLIDTQPVNCIWIESEKKVYFTDLEFCTREDKRGWDVGYFLCFLALRLPEDLKREVSEIFLENYQKERPLNLEDVQKTIVQLKEFLPVFQAVLDIRQFTPEELFREFVLG